MLVIRTEQLAALRDRLKSQYLPALLATMQEEHPEAVVHASAKERLVLAREAIATAGAYGLHDLYEVEQVMQCMLWYGTGFHTERGWARAILNDADLAASEKADALEDAALGHAGGEGEVAV